MKFSCTQENLKYGLNIASPVAAKNTTLPILNNVLVKAEEGGITLMTTNLELGIKCVIRGKVEDKGTYTVNSKLLNEYVNLLPNDTVEVALEDDALEVHCLNYDTKIKGVDAEEFPLLPEVSKKEPFTCLSEELLKGLSQIHFATSLNDSRIEISGVYFNFSGDTLTLAGTDSYRLAEKKIILEGTGQEDKDFILPAKTVSELIRVLSNLRSTNEEKGDEEDTTKKTEIYFEDNQVLFSIDAVSIISRVIEAQFPNYTQIIPTSHSTKALISIDEFAQAVKTTSLFAQTGIFDVHLQLKNNTLIITSTNAQLGENKVEVKAAIDGDDNEITVNYRYLLDGLSNLDATQVQFEMTDSESPCVLRPAESLEGNTPIALEDYIYIIMPLKQ